jgi:anaerobic ribonucleoside-triphosphate reductase activating protein
MNRFKGIMTEAGRIHMCNKVKTIRLFGLTTDSIVDGIGYRTAIFAQGCPHRCEGCHNPESHDPEGGTEWDLSDVERKFSNNPLLDGITLSGGEPFEQPAPFAELARSAHVKGLTVWTYSGYTYEELLALAEQDDSVKALLAETDILVDGPFTLSERSLELPYCGSRNQRVIDLRETREAGCVVLFRTPKW